MAQRRGSHASRKAIGVQKNQAKSLGSVRGERKATELTKIDKSVTKQIVDK